jgi:cytoskeletal protein RodZ
MTEDTSVVGGSSLRALRVSRGLSLEEVSSRLKYSARQITALEEERWDQLPTGMSLRGMIRNYARLLGADPEAVATFLAGHSSVSVRPSVRELGNSPAVGGDEENPNGSSWGWVLFILVVVIAVVGYAFWKGWLPTEWLSLEWLKQRFHR